ncbi:hypothetical protein PTI98_009938 [Pleurotus ostreatus]|nr:hypothetical protein PTI98_009938 [Pleurotus ostreatus]
MLAFLYWIQLTIRSKSNAPTPYVFFLAAFFNGLFTRHAESIFPACNLLSLPSNLGLLLLISVNNLYDRDGLMASVFRNCSDYRGSMRTE